MVWRIKSINHVAIPSHEGEWSYDTEGRSRMRCEMSSLTIGCG